MMTRRHAIHAGFAAGCSACTALALGAMARNPAISATAAAGANAIDGPGYTLHFVGGQRDTIMNGHRAALLDLRSLKGLPHLYGVGPIEGLSGEVTIVNNRPALARVGADGHVHVEESYNAGVPFFVWAEVPLWREVAVPAHVRSYSDLETFVADAGRAAGLMQAFPFLMRGRAASIDFHVVNATPETPPGMAAHRAIQIPFALHESDATFVGFWSSQHQGIFIPMGSNVHIHFRTAAGDLSGHVQGLDLGRGGMTLGLPTGS